MCAICNKSIRHAIYRSSIQYNIRAVMENWWLIFWNLVKSERIYIVNWKFIVVFKTEWFLLIEIWMLSFKDLDVLDLNTKIIWLMDIFMATAGMDAI